MYDTTDFYRRGRHLTVLLLLLLVMFGVGGSTPVHGDAGQATGTAVSGKTYQPVAAQTPVTTQPPAPKPRTGQVPAPAAVRKESTWAPDDAKRPAVSARVMTLARTDQHPGSRSGPDPGSADPAGRVRAALAAAVPAAWRSAVPIADVTVVSGGSSYSSPGGRLQISTYHLWRPWPDFQNAVVHEWGHQVAWTYGTGAFNGAPPAGFPTDGRAHVEETWAQAVAVSLLNYDVPRLNVPAPTPAQVTWTRSWLAAGPAAYPRHP